MKLKFLTFIAACSLFACTSKNNLADYNIIPAPNKVEATSGNFTLSNSSNIIFPQSDEKFKNNAEFLSEYIDQLTGIKCQIKEGDVNSAQKGDILFIIDNNIKEQEGYKIEVSKDFIKISSATAAGNFYGLQTLRKSLPVAKEQITKVNFPCVVIEDAPRYEYRGMMLDVSRHYFPLDFIKKYIDILALHNLNRFHWHLSEDQGWRIEIKKYPRLTEIGSKRSETVIGRNSGKYDGIPYGGFYTQEEAKEIVAYAAKRYITVIPEIDMPGHMLAALASYPELGCTGGPYQVWRQWGVSDEVLCVGKENTIQFVKDVLDEIMEIFPSHFIHIGGDECPKTSWKKCKTCQAKIRKEGLNVNKPGDKHTPEERLQSWFIATVEKHINSKGREIIGWDEILEGGLAPNATVMSWRSMDGGVAAAKGGNRAIMTPTQHVYFDYYQTANTENEPLAIGGYLPVETVYNLKPTPDNVPAEVAKNIIGTQANLWTEYIPTPEHAEYMVLPRMAALCEVAWCSNEKKDYNRFLTAIPHMFDVYSKLGYNYAKHLLEIRNETAINDGDVTLTLSTVDNSPIYYTINDSIVVNGKLNPKAIEYKAPITIIEKCFIEATVLRNNEPFGLFKQDFTINKATAHPISVVNAPQDKYTFNGVPTLVDGIKGAGVNYRNKKWIGFYNNDFIATINLSSKKEGEIGEAVEISSVTINNLINKGDGILDARKIVVSVSEDGENFKQVAQEIIPAMENDNDNQKIITHTLTFDKVATKFVKIEESCELSMPAWHWWGAGKPAYLFIDEIEIN